jgi:hypothetical protein
MSGVLSGPRPWYVGGPLIGNFPVFVVHDDMRAFHPCGHWSSRDGKSWSRSELLASGLNSGYQKYLLFDDAVYSLRTMRGNYLDLHLTSRIARSPARCRTLVLGV